MKVLSYSCLLTLVRTGKIVVNRVEYTVSPDIQSYLSNNLPASGEFLFGDSRLLIFFEPAGLTPGSIVMFAPGGPPDPGVQGGNPAPSPDPQTGP